MGVFAARRARASVLESETLYAVGVKELDRTAYVATASPTLTSCELRELGRRRSSSVLKV